MFAALCSPEIERSVPERNREGIEDEIDEDRRHKIHSFNKTKLNDANDMFAPANIPCPQIHKYAHKNQTETWLNRSQTYRQTLHTSTPAHTITHKTTADKTPETLPPPPSTMTTTTTTTTAHFSTHKTRLRRRTWTWWHASTEIIRKNKHAKCATNPKIHAHRMARAGQQKSRPSKMYVHFGWAVVLECVGQQTSTRCAMAVKRVLVIFLFYNDFISSSCVCKLWVVLTVCTYTR